MNEVVKNFTTIKIEKNSLSEKEPGWESIASLRFTLKASTLKIKEAIEIYRLEHPEWCKMFKFTDKLGRTHSAEYYSPQLKELIREYLIKNKNKNKEKNSEKKPGFKNCSELAQILKTSYVKVKESANKHRASENANEFFQKLYTDNKVLLSENYSPELIELIAKDLGREEELRIYREKEYE
ncbi:MAG: hypothetical protein V4439_01115 [Patescibacteria group bacterium]